MARVKKKKNKKEKQKQRRKHKMHSPNDVFEKQCKCFLRHLPVQKARKKTQNKTKQKPKCRTATAIPPTLLTHLTHSYPTTFAFLLFSCLQRCNVSETATELPNACMQNERSSIVQKGGEEEEEEEAVAGGFGVTTNTRQAAPQCMRKAMKKTCSKIVHSPKK